MVVADVRAGSGGVLHSPILRLQDFSAARRQRASLPLLRRLVDPEPDLAVIDIGGGTGAVTELYAWGCREVVVLEPDRDRVDYGRGRRGRFRFVVGSAESIPFPAHHFDRAVALRSFHHVADHDAALREIHRVLNPSGRLILQELDPSRGRGKVASFVENKLRRGGSTFYTPQDLKGKLERRGFRDVSIEPAPLGYFAVAAKSPSSDTTSSGPSRLNRAAEGVKPTRTE